MGIVQSPVRLSKGSKDHGHTENDMEDDLATITCIYYLFNSLLQSALTDLST